MRNATDHAEYPVAKLVVEALRERFGVEATVSEVRAELRSPPDPKMGDYSFAPFKYAKAAKKSPPEIAKAVVEHARAAVPKQDRRGHRRLTWSGGRPLPADHFVSLQSSLRRGGTTCLPQQTCRPNLPSSSISSRSNVRQVWSNVTSEAPSAKVVVRTFFARVTAIRGTPKQR